MADQSIERITQSLDGDRRYVIQLDNNDRFVQTGKQIIAGCQLGMGVEAWRKEVDALIDYVNSWIEKRTDAVSRCFIVPRGAKICLFFIPQSRTFDFKLASELAPLNIQLFRNFNVGMVEVLQIPEDEIERFIGAGGRLNDGEGGSREDSESYHAVES